MKEEESFAMQILKSLKREVRALLIINSVLVLLFAYSCYDSIKIRDDIGVIETTTEQTIEGVENINNSSITNGGN